MTPFHDTLLTLSRAQRQAQAAGLDLSDTTALLMGITGRSRAWLRAHGDEPLSALDIPRWQDALARRVQGEPVAYITGEKAFHGLVLQVDARVLVPRPDTETLVDWALDLLNDYFEDPARWGRAGPPGPLQVADLGCGSGAIALALAHEAKRRQWPLTVHAVDLSPDALAVTAANAQTLNLPVQLHAGSWCAALGAQRMDLIVSNPPYVAEGDPHLPALRHEPRQALIAGPQGLDDLHRIVAQAPAQLFPQSWLLLEHGWDQAWAVCDALRQGGAQSVHSRKDLAGIDRCSGGLWPGRP